MGVSRRQFVQLCWTCKFACDRHACKWVRTLKDYYKGSELDKDGFIIKCPKYEHDGQIYNVRDKAKALGITYDRYKAIQIHLKKFKDRNIYSVEDYLKYQEDKKKYREECAKYTHSQINYATSMVKKRQLKMTPIEYIEKFILPKKNKNATSKEYHREYQNRKYREKIERELLMKNTNINKKIDSNDIYGELDKYADYELKIIDKVDESYKQVAKIPNAFSDSLYYIKSNSEEKILYKQIV